MDIKINAYSCLCELEEFEINGIKADYEDFGSKYDTSPEEAEDYCCGDMQFVPNPATQKVLNKYKINANEYNDVCEKLNVLSFGCCNWCS